MLELLRSAWQKVQPALQASVGREVYDAWLADLRPLALERGVMHFEAPNRMACERVVRLFTGRLAELLSAELGTEIRVSVEPAPESLSPDQLEVGPGRPLIDDGNRTAFLALQALLERRHLPARLFLLYGPPGSGKTFLLRQWLAARRGAAQRFDGPGLVKAFGAAMRDRRLPALRAELCEDRSLVIDELHRIAGHRRVQLELARILEKRSQLEAPTLMASRWHPHEIRDLTPVLATWLLSGFVSRLDLPGPAARLAYLRALEGPPSHNGRSEVIERLARDLQAGYPALRRAWALDRHGGAHQRARYWQLIEPRSAFHRARDRVAAQLGVPVEELVGRGQGRRLSRARKVLAWLCVQEGLSRAEIGRFLGRTRAAISYAVRSLHDEMAADDALRVEVEKLL